MSTNKQTKNGSSGSGTSPVNSSNRRSFSSSPSANLRQHPQPFVDAHLRPFFSCLLPLLVRKNNNKSGNHDKKRVIVDMYIIGPPAIQFQHSESEMVMMMFGGPPAAVRCRHLACKGLRYLPSNLRPPASWPRS